MDQLYYFGDLSYHIIIELVAINQFHCPVKYVAFKVKTNDYKLIRNTTNYHSCQINF